MCSISVHKNIKNQDEREGGERGKIKEGKYLLNY